MPGQPAATIGQELGDLVVADEVVLLIVEHRNQDVEVREQIGESRRRRQRDRDVWSFAPLREMLVERLPLCLDGVAQGPEDFRQPSVAAADGEHVDARGKRNGSLRELGPVLAPALQSRAVHLRDRHAEKRRSRIRTIVDVLRKQTAAGPLASDQPDGVYIEK